MISNRTRVALGTLALAVLLPTASHATNLDIFAEVVGASQGLFQGDETYPGEEDMIALTGFSHEIAVPYDPGTGLPTGTPVHGPIVFRKRHDRSTTLILQALLQNENLLDVAVRFYDGNQSPGTALLYIVELENARIISRTEDEDTTTLFGEQVELLYQTITWTWLGLQPLTTQNPDQIVLRQALLPPSPNPTRAATTFRFGLPHETHADIRVFDVGGRLVREIFSGTAGLDEIARWDGRNGAGLRVASGVYLVRLAWEGGEAMRRVTVLE